MERVFKSRKQGLTVGRVREITMHRHVSRVCSGVEKREPGTDAIIKVRRTMSSNSAAKRNASEEAPLAARLGPERAWDAGLIVCAPRLRAEYVARRFASALAAGLPADLASLVDAWLTDFGAERNAPRHDA